MNTTTAGIVIALGVIALVVGLLLLLTTVFGGITHHTSAYAALVVGVILLIVGIYMVVTSRSRNRL